MARTLAELSRGRDNNFNLTRALAAVAVIVTHAFVLTGHGDDEPGTRLLGSTLGSIAVDLFFVVSGFLITKSWERHRRPTDFFYARFMRIFPALWLSVALCVLVVGPIFTSLPLGQFFGHLDTLKFVLNDTTLLLNGVATHLPSTFVGQGPGGINVSLWTLPYELRMYLLLALLGFAGVLRRPWLVGAMVALCGGYYLWHLGMASDGGRLLVHARLIYFFFAGALLFVHRQRVVLSHRRAGAVAGAFLLTCWLVPTLELRQVALALVLPWLALYLAVVPGGPIRAFNRLGDYSYGLYIFAFPVQQSVIAVAGGDMNPWLNFGWSLLVTLGLAMLSWHLLEERALHAPQPAWLLRLDRNAVRWWQDAVGPWPAGAPQAAAAALDRDQDATPPAERERSVG